MAYDFFVILQEQAELKRRLRMQFGKSIYNDMTKIFTETETGKHPQSLHTVSKPMI